MSDRGSIELYQVAKRKRQMEISRLNSELNKANSAGKPTKDIEREYDKAYSSKVEDWLGR